MSFRFEDLVIGYFENLKMNDSAKKKEHYDWWEDNDFLTEMKQRIDDFESGRDKGMSWEDAKKRARIESQSRQTKTGHLTIIKS